MRASLAAMVLALTACGGGSPLPDGGNGSAGYELNDVSFLYPLPSWPDRDGLMSMESSGAQGPLLPRALFNQLPVLFIGITNADIYPALRIVSLRVDPCFPGSTPPEPKVCKKQLRMVAQPLVQQGADGGSRW